MIGHDQHPRARASQLERERNRIFKLGDGRAASPVLQKLEGLIDVIRSLAQKLRRFAGEDEMRRFISAALQFTLNRANGAVARAAGRVVIAGPGQHRE